MATDKLTVPGQLRLVQRDGRDVLQKKYQFSDGRVEWIDYEEVVREQRDSFMDRFKDTETVPADHAPLTQGAIAARDAVSGPQVHAPLTQGAIAPKRDAMSEGRELLGTEFCPSTEAFVRQSRTVYLSIHALLLKYLGGEPKDVLARGQQMRVSGEAWEMLYDLTRLMGGDWPRCMDLVKKKHE